MCVFCIHIYPLIHTSTNICYFYHRSLPSMTQDEIFQIICSLGRVRVSWTNMHENVKSTLTHNLINILKKQRDIYLNSVLNKIKDSRNVSYLNKINSNDDVNTKNNKHDIAQNSYVRYAKECLLALCKLGTFILILIFFIFSFYFALICYHYLSVNNFYCF